MEYKIYLEARRKILFCLDRRRKWGGSHTSVKNLARKLPIAKRGGKEVKKAIGDLVLEGKVMLKKTVEDDHVSLNPRFTKEIHEEINNNIIL